MFQATPPREGRLRLTLALVRYKDVSIHAPREGRRGRKATFDWLFEFQSTPPHEGRPKFALDTLPLRIVSIHAPTRGATSSVRAVNGKCVVSIHAPTRGATRLALYIQC